MQHSLSKQKHKAGCQRNPASACSSCDKSTAGPRVARACLLSALCPAALRAEVATYEGQLEAERRAHAATKAAAATRERDLEEQLGSSR